MDWRTSASRRPPDGGERRPGGLLAAIASGIRVHDLAQPLREGIPGSPNHPAFRLVPMLRHGDLVIDGSSVAAEAIITGGHVGTHVDALAHVAHHGRLHAGVDAAGAHDRGVFTRHGIDELSPVVARGVLLDVARMRGEDMLAPAHPIGIGDLEAALELAGTTLRDGDAALIRTGWARRFDDAEAFLGVGTGAPGVTEDGARWLADHGVSITGSDTLAYEWIGPGAAHTGIPVHRLLLVERGIPIVEMLDLEALSEAAVSEFCFVLAPLKLVGATGSPVRPLALVEEVV
jgi:kynurenine formamidase